METSSRFLPDARWLELVDPSFAMICASHLELKSLISSQRKSQEKRKGMSKGEIRCSGDLRCRQSLVSSGNFFSGREELS